MDTETSRRRSASTSESSPAPDDVPEPQTPVTSPVEPQISLSTFAVINTLRPAHLAALRAWMRASAHDPDGHYALDTLDGLYRDMLTSTPGA